MNWKRLLLDRQLLIRLIVILSAILLTLLLLVAIPLLTHRQVVPDTHTAERLTRPVVTPEPTPVRIEPASPAEPQPDEALRSLLEDFASQHSGTWDLYVCSLKDGSYAGTGPGEPMVSASLIKMFIMAAIYDRIEAGTDTVRSTQTMLRDMIIKSDNYSANRLIGHLGDGDDEESFAALNAFAASIGCDSTQLNRKMLDNNGLQNYTSAEDCGKLLRQIYRMELITPKWSAEMLDLLKSAWINDRIVSGLPKNTVCAHKTGDLEGICCADAGIVFSPNNDYILVAICNYPDNDKEANLAITELSRAIYAYYNAEIIEENTEDAP